MGLNKLVVTNDTGKIAEDWTLLHFGAIPPRTTALSTLEVSGIDVRTLEPVFGFPRHLKNLKINFDSDATRALLQGFMEQSTDELLTRAFTPLFSTLRMLDFRHRFLTNFQWGKFKTLLTLRVHMDHIFPDVSRPWGDLRYRDLIPESLFILTITGCKFGEDQLFRSPDDGKCMFERSLLRLAEEYTKASRRLWGVRLVLDPSSKKPVPKDIEEQFVAASLGYSVGEDGPWRKGQDNRDYPTSVEALKAVIFGEPVAALTNAQYTDPDSTGVRRRIW